MPQARTHRGRKGRKFAGLAAGDEDAFPEIAALDTTPRTSRYAEMKK